MYSYSFSKAVFQLIMGRWYELIYDMSQWYDENLTHILFSKVIRCWENTLIEEKCDLYPWYVTLNGLRTIYQIRGTQL